MKRASSQDAVAVFDPLRPSLVRIAYRMLGSVADAEDVVQDAFLRWLDVDRDVVREPAAFLRRVVTRLCLDRLKSVRRERETYVGSWLPEPVLESGEDELDDVTLPLLMALERLSPLERAAFLLHDVFSLDFEEVAATIGRDPAACRQLASRARAHVRADRPRYPVLKERGIEIAEAFFAASRDGEMERLRALLAADVTVYADGGGKASAHGAPVAGLDNVMRLFATFAPVFAASRSRLVRYGFINGLPGFVTIERGDILQTTALEIEDGRVVAVFVVRNPDKLRHVADTVH
jgi:RNA polymerase sigma-70 factor, ECF subfamily